MQKDSILYILKGHGVSEDDLKIFSTKLKEKNFTTTDCDKLLVKMGYDTVFTEDEDMNDLRDLKNSIEEDGKSKNIELLSSLLESAKDTIKEKSLLVHEVAKEKMK